MSEPQKVIIYRSKQEQILDDFWSAHPEVGLIVVGAIVGFFLLAFIGMAVAQLKFWRKWNDTWRKF